MDTPQYELDDDTEALLRTVLELAVCSSNLQIDPHHSEIVVDICTQLAHRFGLEVLTEQNEIVDSEQLRLDLGNLPFTFRIIDKDPE